MLLSKRQTDGTLGDTQSRTKGRITAQVIYKVLNLALREFMNRAPKSTTQLSADIWLKRPVKHRVSETKLLWIPNTIIC